jgi:hypothetical protein
MTRDEIVIGAYYRGARTRRVYQVVMFAMNAETNSPMVVFKCGPIAYVRSVETFCDGRYEPIDMSKRGERDAS